MQRRRLLLGLFACLFLALSPCSQFVLADDAQSERGRLPDGRAFRTDQEGNQLVDYIAELELEKEGLEGRIFKLQDQVREAQTGATSARECQPNEITQPAKTSECPPVTCPRVEAVSCPSCSEKPEQLVGLESRIERMTKENVELDKEKSALIEQLGSCQTEAERTAIQSASLRETLADLKKALTERDAALVATRSQVSDLRQERDRLIAVRKTEGLENSRASFKKFDNVTPSNRANSTTANAASALSVAQGQLLARLLEIKSQVRARDEQFARIDQRGKALQVNPAPLKTRSGFELKNAEAMIHDAPNFRRIAEISREISELQRIVSDDIKLGARLSRAK